MSIKYHLMLRLLIASLLIVGGGTWMGYKDTQLEIRELFDAQLARSARLILSMVQADEGQSDFSNIQRYLDENQIPAEEPGYSAESNRDPGAGHIYETKLAFQVWDNLGNLILKSPNVPIQPIAGEKNGFDNRTFLDNDWRVFSLYSHNHKYRCITAERVDVRNDLITKLSHDLFLLFITLIPALSIVMWLAITQGLSPLRNLASQISRRDASRLDAVSNINAPSEIQTIAGALNSLLSRLSLALDRERRISSDAAHELRTPLAAVRLHAELAKKSTTESDRDTALNHVLQGIDRTTHLVDQLLALAKLEPEFFSQNLTTINLRSIVIEETAMLAPMAHRKNIELAVDEFADTYISADSTSLRLLLRNLLDNAISYTQDNGSIEVKVSSTNESVNLIIQDNGPGIPAEQHERVCERFYRIGDSEVPGCGIGLSIVIRVIELHHASLKMSQPANGTGLIVTVSFPVD